MQEFLPLKYPLTICHYNPIDKLNEECIVERDFFYKNYSPAETDRMYFTANNAGRIDFYRNKIQVWYDNGTISDSQYQYLLGCLLEAVSKVSNTAGVYGAFLKNWDKRALNQITLSALPTDNLFSNPPKVSIECFNNQIEDIVGKVDCDILYLDPPYTQNQYGTQYHLLETLVLNDNPIISKVTGSRPVTPLKSKWSVNYECHQLLDYVISHTKAKYILMSYNNDGFMTKDFIEACFKRYGDESTYVCKTLSYKKYNNKKCQGADGHVEYIFFIEKKPLEKIVYESPLNYTGSKFKMMEFIRQNLPNTKIEKFVDAFGGGFNVGINIENQTIYNDINFFVKDLLQSFKDIDTTEYLKRINKYITKYDLSTKNTSSYIKIRADYNATPIEKRDPVMLYTIILFGFQQQIRFNSDFGFNNPAGSRHFNDKILEKFISFSRIVKSRKVNFLSGDYEQLKKYAQPNCFFYFDPPYTNTLGVYNDGKRGFLGWNQSHENKLLQFIDSFNKGKIKFMLSYIIENDGITNDKVLHWIKENNYKMIEVPQMQGRYNNRKEVIIKNY